MRAYGLLIISLTAAVLACQGLYCANNMLITTGQGHSVTIPLALVPSICWQSLTITPRSWYGTARINRDAPVAQLIYTPFEHLGTDLIELDYIDELGALEQTFITIEIVPGPQAVSAHYHTVLDRPLLINMGDKNTGTNSATTTCAIIDAPAHGMLTWQGNTALHYRPHQGFIGTDIFDYELTDGASNTSSRARITIEVLPLAHNNFIAMLQQLYGSATN